MREREIERKCVLLSVLPLSPLLEEEDLFFFLEDDFGLSEDMSSFLATWKGVYIIVGSIVAGDVRDFKISLFKC